MILKLILVCSFVASSLCAFGEWQEYQFCDFDQTILAQTHTPAPQSPYYLEDCEEFCHESSEDGSDLEEGEPLCCDFEALEDGSFNCYLFKGSYIIPHDQQFGPQNYYSSFSYNFGEHASYLGISMGLMMGICSMSV